MVRCLWEEYKECHLAGRSQVSSYTTSFGQQRDAEDFEVYLHHFRAIDGRAAFEVTKDGDGRFFVTLDDQATPAVPTARAIQFTTGDVVGAKGVPQLKLERHATLECYEIVRVNGKFYIADLGVSDVTSQAVELEVVNETEAAESKK